MKTRGTIFPSILSSFLFSLEIDAFQSIHGKASSKNSAFVKSSHPLSLVSSDANLSSLSNRHSSLVMYDDSNSKPSSDTSKTDIVWTTLSNTEKWIQKTLGVSSGSMSSSNPYTRKEVAYVCETSDLTEEVVAGVFRRLREMREMGVGHGQAEQELSKTQGEALRAVADIIMVSNNSRLIHLVLYLCLYYYTSPSLWTNRSRIQTTYVQANSCCRITIL
jgi:hypothetical protein